MLSICNNCCIKLSKYWSSSERISKLEPFINNYNWKDIEFPSHSKDWRKFECNNKTIALNILYVPYNAKQVRQASTSECDNEHDNEHDNEYDHTKQIRPAYISKHNNECDTPVNLLMIIDGTSNWN